MAERLLSDHLCECGCGQYTLVSLTTKKPNRFVFPHNDNHERAMARNSARAAEANAAWETATERQRAEWMLRVSLRMLARLARKIGRRDAAPTSRDLERAERQLRAIVEDMQTVIRLREGSDNA